VPVRPASARPIAARPASARPASARPASAPPIAARPAGARPIGARPIGARPIGVGVVVACCAPNFLVWVYVARVDRASASPLLAQPDLVTNPSGLVQAPAGRHVEQVSSPIARDDDSAGPVARP
jgi:hypothetical protein